MSHRALLATETRAPAAPVADHRVHERLPCELETSCQPPVAWGNKDLKWTAQIRDISQSGLALLLQRRFEVGAGLALELPGPDPETPSTVLVRVVRIAPGGNGGWLLGCAFVSQLSEEEVWALARTTSSTGTATAPAVKSVEASPVAPSRRLPASRIQVTEVDFEARLGDGQVYTRRFRKLVLLEGWPLAEGDRFLLQTSRAAPGGAPLRLRVEECCRRDERWLLRCTLVDASAHEVARALGTSRSLNGSKAGR